MPGVLQQHLSITVKHGQPARCPQCGMWVEPNTERSGTSFRKIWCWCENWLDITYVSYVIDELGMI